MNKMLAVATCVILSLNFNLFKRELAFNDMPVERRAELAQMEVEEFVFISSVVEAESNRCTDSTEGRRYIALTILNRVNDDRFPDTITEVLCQSGQFSTVRNGSSVTGRTDLSDLAVVEAVEWINSGEECPNVLFFNCIGYNMGTPYAYIGGNYFMEA